MRYNTTYSNFQIHPQSYQKQWLSHACRMQHVFELRVVHVVHESSARFPWTWLDCSSCWKFKLADNQILFRNMWVSPSWLRREKDFEGRKDTIREAIFEEVFVVSPVWAYVYGNISPAQTSLAWFEEELPFLLRMWAHLKPEDTCYSIWYSIATTRHSLLSTLWFCNSKVLGKNQQISHSSTQGKRSLKRRMTMKPRQGSFSQDYLVHRIFVASQNVFVNICHISTLCKPELSI